MCISGRTKGEFSTMASPAPAIPFLICFSISCFLFVDSVDARSAAGETLRFHSDAVPADLLPQQRKLSSSPLSPPSSSSFLSLPSSSSSSVASSLRRLSDVRSGVETKGQFPQGPSTSREKHLAFQEIKTSGVTQMRQLSSSRSLPVSRSTLSLSTHSAGPPSSGSSHLSPAASFSPLSPHTPQVSPSGPRTPPALVQLQGAPAFSGQLGSGVDLMPDSEEDISIMPNCMFYSSYAGSCIPGAAHSPCRYCRAKQFSGLYGAAQCPSFLSFPPELQALYRWRITPAKRSRVKGWTDELVCVVEKTQVADQMQMQMNQSASEAAVRASMPAAGFAAGPSPFVNPYAFSQALPSVYAGTASLFSVSLAFLASALTLLKS
ncbi:putative transmembrane protein [Toxoplasma gondii CAST]|uniref:Putative transmembrane protein n=1 Tax=Toxoplasma gondii CAST TaxID=943122 RepID=A0A3R8AKE3_TOXGO|nr:putative transmembrane protein [Toxoplasma gondii CAST]